MNDLEFLPHFIAIVAVPGLLLYYHIRDLNISHFGRMPTTCPCCGEKRFYDMPADPRCIAESFDGSDRRHFECGTWVSSYGGRAGYEAPRMSPCSQLFFKRPHHADHRA
jgi:hypothetical protein